MALDILEAISKLAPVLAGMSAAGAKTQDTNALINNNAASTRPGLVSQNMSNARIASMMRNYTPPKLNWGGPGSVNRGQQVTMSGGPGADSPEVSQLEDQVQKDALAQANKNYGLKDPSDSSAGSDVLGGLSSTASILGALSKIKLGGGGAPSSGPTSGPSSPATFGTISPPPAGSGDLNPSQTHSPFDFADQGGPTDIRAYGPEAIDFLRRMGVGVGGSSTEPMTGNPYI